MSGFSRSRRTIRDGITLVDANMIQSVIVDVAGIGDGKVLAYDLATKSLKYVNVLTSPLTADLDFANYDLLRCGNLKVAVSGQKDIGESARKFKDLHLSGTAFIPWAYLTYITGGINVWFDSTYFIGSNKHLGKQYFEWAMGWFDGLYLKPKVAPTGLKGMFYFDSTLEEYKYYKTSWLRMTGGLTDTITFEDNNKQGHTVVIENGLIQSWTII